MEKEWKAARKKIMWIVVEDNEWINQVDKKKVFIPFDILRWHSLLSCILMWKILRLLRFAIFIERW